jgi:predicted ATPase
VRWQGVALDRSGRFCPARDRGIIADRAIADASASWVYFDRGLIDAAAALAHLTREPVVESLGLAYRYNKRVFLAPPWSEIYTLDQERRHGLTEAVAEYNRLIDVCPLWDTTSMCCPNYA